MSRLRSRPTVEQALGEVLRSLREERELSQERLAHDAGFHRNYVGMVERGERGPTVDALFRLAKALSMRPRDVIAKVEEARPVSQARGSRRR
jgi:transcriptional regulator with XRE-family HTH domain